jgi:hypothetical protein
MKIDQKAEVSVSVPYHQTKTVLETFISKSRKVAMSPAQSLFFFFAEKLEFSYTTNPSFML